MRTLEDKFLQKYEELEEELRKAKQEIEELKTLKEEDEQETALQPVFIATISKEVCELKFDDKYYIKQSSQYKNMSSNDIKAILDNDTLLREFANEINDYHSWDKQKFVNVETGAYPYSCYLQGVCVVLELSYKKDSVYSYIVNKFDENNAKANKYYDIKYKDQLYEIGLKMFKEELEKAYQYKLKEESEEN